MFGFLRRRTLKGREKQIKTLIMQAKGIYESQQKADEALFHGLIRIAREQNITAREAAETPEGKMLAIDYVLSRQYACYLNESAIQHYARLVRINRQADDLSREEWYDKVVKPSGAAGIVLQEIPQLCGSIINDAQKHV